MENQKICSLNFQLGESLNQPTFAELCSTDERTEFEAQKRFYENAKPNSEMLRYGDLTG